MIEKIKEDFIDISNKYYDKTGYDYWNNHVKYVVDIASSLALKYGADKEIVGISAILHDVAKPLEIRGNESHNIVGADIAEEKLKKLNFNQNKIEKVKDCILNHSGSVNVESLSKEEWCVRNADIISIFNNISIFYYLAYKEYNLSYEEGIKYVKDIATKKISDLDRKLYKDYETNIEFLFDLF